MMRVQTGCYCCPAPADTAHSAMDLDSALNELGMLSSITESRRQYLQEKARRDSLEKSRGRNLSEPSLGTLVTATPSNSPSKSSASGYQVLQINPQYVVSLSTSVQESLPPSSYYSPTKDNDSDSEPITFGTKYSQENIEYQTKHSRTARLKLARLKRFKKPYEVPWRNTEHRYNICHPTPSPGPILSMPVTTASAPRTSDRLCVSVTSTPEKPTEGSTVPRSKSLDELDFSKLQLAEAENHNFILERKEIDTVSNNFQKLHVNE